MSDRIATQWQPPLENSSIDSDAWKPKSLRSKKKDFDFAPQQVAFAQPKTEQENQSPVFSAPLRSNSLSRNVVTDAAQTAPLLTAPVNVAKNLEVNVTVPDKRPLTNFDVTGANEIVEPKLQFKNLSDQIPRALNIAAGQSASVETAAPVLRSSSTGVNDLKPSQQFLSDVPAVHVADNGRLPTSRERVTDNEPVTVMRVVPESSKESVADKVSGIPPTRVSELVKEPVADKVSAIPPTRVSELVKEPGSDKVAVAPLQAIPEVAKARGADNLVVPSPQVVPDVVKERIGDNQIASMSRVAPEAINERIAVNEPVPPTRIQESVKEAIVDKEAVVPLQTTPEVASSSRVSPEVINNRIVENKIVSPMRVVPESEKEPVFDKISTASLQINPDLVKEGGSDRQVVSTSRVASSVTNEHAADSKTILPTRIVSDEVNERADKNDVVLMKDVAREEVIEPVHRNDVASSTTGLPEGVKGSPIKSDVILKSVAADVVKDPIGRNEVASSAQVPVVSKANGTEPPSQEPIKVVSSAMPSSTGEAIIDKVSTDRAKASDIELATGQRAAVNETPTVKLTGQRAAANESIGVPGPITSKVQESAQKSEIHDIGQKTPNGQSEIRELVPNSVANQPQNRAAVFSASNVAVENRAEGAAIAGTANPLTRLNSEGKRASVVAIASESSRSEKSPSKIIQDSDRVNSQNVLPVEARKEMPVTRVATAAENVPGENARPTEARKEATVTKAGTTGENVSLENLKHINKALETTNQPKLIFDVAKLQGEKSETQIVDVLSGAGHASDPRPLSSSLSQPELLAKEKGSIMDSIFASSVENQSGTQPQPVAAVLPSSNLSTTKIGGSAETPGSQDRLIGSDGPAQLNASGARSNQDASSRVASSIQLDHQSEQVPNTKQAFPTPPEGGAQKAQFVAADVTRTQANQKQDEPKLVQQNVASSVAEKTQFAVTDAIRTQSNQKQDATKLVQQAVESGGARKKQFVSGDADRSQSSQKQDEPKLVQQAVASSGSQKAQLVSTDALRTQANQKQDVTKLVQETVATTGARKAELVSTDGIRSQPNQKQDEMKLGQQTVAAQSNARADLTRVLLEQNPVVRAAQPAVQGTPAEQAVGSRAIQPPIKLNDQITAARADLLSASNGQPPTAFVARTQLDQNAGPKQSVADASAFSKIVNGDRMSSERTGQLLGTEKIDVRAPLGTQLNRATALGFFDSIATPLGGRKDPLSSSIAWASESAMLRSVKLDGMPTSGNVVNRTVPNLDGQISATVRLVANDHISDGRQQSDGIATRDAVRFMQALANQTGSARIESGTASKQDTPSVKIGQTTAAQIDNAKVESGVISKDIASAKVILASATQADYAKIELGAASKQDSATAKTAQVFGSGTDGGGNQRVTPKQDSATVSTREIANNGRPVEGNGARVPSSSVASNMVAPGARPVPNAVTANGATRGPREIVVQNPNGTTRTARIVPALLTGSTKIAAGRNDVVDGRKSFVIGSRLDANTPKRFITGVELAVISALVAVARVRPDGRVAAGKANSKVDGTSFVLKGEPRKLAELLENFSARKAKVFNGEGCESRTEPAGRGLRAGGLTLSAMLALSGATRADEQRLVHEPVRHAIRIERTIENPPRRDEPERTMHTRREEPVRITFTRNEEPVRATSMRHNEPVRTTSTRHDEPVRGTSKLHDESLRGTSTRHDEPVRTTSTRLDESTRTTSTRQIETTQSDAANTHASGFIVTDEFGRIQRNPGIEKTKPERVQDDNAIKITSNVARPVVAALSREQVAVPKPSIIKTQIVDSTQQLVQGQIAGTPTDEVANDNYRFVRKLEIIARTESVKPSDLAEQQGYSPLVSAAGGVPSTPSMQFIEVAEVSDESEIASEEIAQKRVLYRPTWLVRPGDTLVSIAEMFFQDRDLGWLIADLNQDRLRESSIDGRRVIEVRSREKLELPVAEDIAEFYRNRPAGSNSDRLITIVVESQIDRELLDGHMSKLMFFGGRR